MCMCCCLCYIVTTVCMLSCRVMHGWLNGCLHCISLYFTALNCAAGWTCGDVKSFGSRGFFLRGPLDLFSLISLPAVCSHSFIWSKMFECQSVNGKLQGQTVLYLKSCYVASTLCSGFTVLFCTENNEVMNFKAGLQTDGTHNFRFLELIALHLVPNSSKTK